MATDDSKKPPMKVVEFRPKDKLWDGPADMIADFAARTVSGEITPANAIIVWFDEDKQTGRLTPHRWRANVSNAEEVAFLEVAKQHAIEDWRDE